MAFPKRSDGLEEGALPIHRLRNNGFTEDEGVHPNLQCLLETNKKEDCGGLNENAPPWVHTSQYLVPHWWVA